jgi:hypothetical protein
VQPDAEAWVWQQLEGLTGVTSFCYAAFHDHIPWVAAYSIQVDARGSTKQQARDRAEQARQIMCSLPGKPWPQGVVCYAQVVEGPFWLPDNDAGPRYCARYEIRAHPPS